MASLSQLITKPPCPSKGTARAASSCSFLPAQARAPRSLRTQKRTPTISCSAKNQNDSDPALNRRDVLIGLGGLYGATAAVSTKHTAKADPVVTPDITDCHVAKDLPPGAIATTCCPPKLEAGKTVKLFTPPGLDTPLRVRPAAHLADQAYINKFSKALALMRNLPPDDPRSFQQQAMIHCAYCDGAYSHVGLPEIELQVHNSWLFFPFHRCYLYYFERILGSLINDPTFAIPFWNWDSPAGMTVPAMYTNPRYPMFDVFRNPEHMKPEKMVDLDYFEHIGEGDKHGNLSQAELAQHNLAIMNRQMRTNSSTPELFFGQAYRKGQPSDPGAGSIENIPHTSLHIWCGDPKQPNSEDMGNFYSAGRDPLFYAHHSNVDRMWNIWKTLGTRNVDICDTDFLNAAFYLYDENKDLVRITVADCLDSERLMRYKYQDVPVEWLNVTPAAAKTGKTSFLEARKVLKEAKFPLVLDQAVRATVKRPKVNRSVVEKKAQEEILRIDGIKLNRDLMAKFDVIINARDKDVITKEHREFLGSFANLPRKHKHDKMDMSFETSAQFGLNEVIDDLDVNGNETIEVTLVPVTNGDKVTISGLSISLSG